MMKVLQKLLAFFSRLILNRYKPKVVGITGSIGKTSTKEACFTVLKNKFSVRRNVKNYNNEIGVPLTIIGAETGGRSLFKWLRVFVKAFKLWIKKDPDYPKVLILEMGADKPGDIRYLTGIAPLDIGIITKVSPVHIEFFGTIEKIAREKGSLIRNFGEKQIAILNFDDKLVRAMAGSTPARVISYGFAEDAVVKVIGANVSLENDRIKGLSFKLVYQGSTVPMFLPGVIGFHQLYAAMAGAACGIALGMNMVDISQALQLYRAPKGRMHLIDGINGSTIIDDSYNSSPDAAAAAIEAAGKLPRRGQLIGAFGEMLELGDLAVEKHQELGQKAVAAGFNRIYAVGKLANQIRKGASIAGMNLKNIEIFENSDQAAKKIIQNIQTGDLILIKGSQGPRMEKVTKALMAHPERATQLLVRQSKAWLKQ
ncbi:MAG: UDP-N-acetylmuramoyl-tripeptide--D-alanyl-D-alanine ligase [Patescibacteria group bacterium]